MVTTSAYSPLTAYTHINIEMGFPCPMDLEKHYMNMVLCTIRIGEPHAPKSKEIETVTVQTVCKKISLCSNYKE